MKRLFLIPIAFMCCAIATAQETADTLLSPDVERVLYSWLSFAQAATTSDRSAIAASADQIRSCQTKDFAGLMVDDEDTTSLNGHLVYDELFADSLAAGNNDVYRHSEDYDVNRASRGQTSDGSILTKTLVVKRGESVRCTFNAKGHQELAVAAEAGGLITMRIGVTNSAGLNKRYDDTKDVKRGRNYRKAVFDMPTNRRNVVTLEIVNCSDRDVSVVVISN